MSKGKRSVEDIINKPSRYEGDETHIYHPTADGELGWRDYTGENLEAFSKALVEGMPTAEEAVHNLMVFFASDFETPTTAKGKKRD